MSLSKNSWPLWSNSMVRKSSFRSATDFQCTIVATWDQFTLIIKCNCANFFFGQFEDFANHNAFDLLTKYSKSHLVFNDDIQVNGTTMIFLFFFYHFSFSIESSPSSSLLRFMVVPIWNFGWLQGTASVVLAGLLAALKVVGGTLAEHTYLFLGAGEVSNSLSRCTFFSFVVELLKICIIWIEFVPINEIIHFRDTEKIRFWLCIWLQAGTGIAELIALQMSKQVACYIVSESECEKISFCSCSAYC